MYSAGEEFEKVINGEHELSSEWLFVVEQLYLISTTVY